MSNTYVPMISSGVAGPLGVLHLPRLWLKASLEAIDNITRTIVLVYRAVPGGAPATMETAVVDGVKADLAKVTP